MRGDLKRCLIVSPGSLVEQWREELYQRFQLPFEILTREKIDNTRTGNPFQEQDLLIGRLDQLSRNEEVQAKLEATDWDVIVCDEAHRCPLHSLGAKCAGQNATSWESCSGNSHDISYC